MRADGLYFSLTREYTWGSWNHSGLWISFDTSCNCETPQASGEGSRRGKLEAGYEHNTPKKHKRNYLLLSLFTGLKEEKNKTGIHLQGENNKDHSSAPCSHGNSSQNGRTYSHPLTPIKSLNTNTQAGLSGSEAQSSHPLQSWNKSYFHYQHPFTKFFYFAGQEPKSFLGSIQ